MNEFFQYLIIFLMTTLLTAWLNVKFIRDAKGTDQYWHIAQLYQQCWIYLSYIFMNWINTTFPVKFALVLGGYAFMYMLIYNSLLNIMRRLKISHLGRYDIFSFTTTIILFAIGFIWLIILYFLKFN